MRDFIGRGGAALYMKTIDIITTYNLLKAQCEESYNRVKEAERIAKSDIEYITKERATRAVKLLADPSLSMEDIAEQCGFGDKSSLYRAFEKYFGCSPSEYRKTLLMKS